LRAEFMGGPPRGAGAGWGRGRARLPNRRKPRTSRRPTSRCKGPSRSLGNGSTARPRKSKRPKRVQPSASVASRGVEEGNGNFRSGITDLKFRISDFRRQSLCLQSEIIDLK
jgi:hypothetical protein